MLLRMVRSMRQSELDEYQGFGKLTADGRILCPKECGRYKSLINHWAQVHDEPFPQGVPKMAEDTRQKMADSSTGKTHSKEHE